MKLFKFSLWILLAFIVADFCYSRLYRCVRSVNMESWREVMEGRASADIYISGDSRACMDCYPPVIDSVTGLRSYSGGVIGHHFTIQKLRYDMFRRYNQKPTLVIQLVDNWLFDPMSEYNREQFLPWMWNIHFLKGMVRLEPVPSLGLLIPWYRYHSLYLGDLAWTPDESRRGFANYNNHKSNEPFSRLPDNRLVLNTDNRSEALFREHLSEVSSEGIKQVLVMAPLYDSMNIPEDIIGKIRNHFRELAEEHGIPFLDYTDRLFCEDESFFIDSDHLNIKGAKAFSDSLANDLIKLGLI